MTRTNDDEPPEWAKEQAREMMAAEEPSDDEETEKGDGGETEEGDGERDADADDDRVRTYRPIPSTRRSGSPGSPDGPRTRRPPRSTASGATN